MTSKTRNNFSPEVRARAVRLVLDHAGDHPSSRAGDPDRDRRGFGPLPAGARPWRRAGRGEDRFRLGDPATLLEADQVGRGAIALALLERDFDGVKFKDGEMLIKHAA